MADMIYNPRKIEPKWQRFWKQKKIYNAKDKGRRKYILAEFPYPSGEGLHMGHLRPYVAGDVYSRYWRMRGQEVMYPMGWDSFGLPAENFAIKKGVHPSITTKQNIKNAKRQVQSWGIGFDWSREINTTDPEYYKWTQWIFLQFYKAGLAYEATGLINWCPVDKTGLANEEVIDGHCERCGALVEKKELRQWYLKITAYAEKLLEGLKNLPDWPEQVKLQQANWIGKSEGSEIEFPLNVAASNALIIHGVSGNSRENWFPWLKSSLEKNNWNVVVPDLPGVGRQTVDEWNDALMRVASDLDENSVIVGHSMGAPAALNLVQTLDKKIGKLVMVAPVNPNQHWQQLKKDHPKLDWDAVKSFAEIKFDWKKISSLAGEIVIYYSDNDKYIPAETVNFYKQNLPSAVFKFLPGKGHFTKSSGNTEFPEILENFENGIKVFTTRADTIFGGTYLVLAPEHNMVESLRSTIENWQEVKKYVEQAKHKTDIQRAALDKEKTGVELKGVKAINPATKEKIPVWVADFVLAGYGTGAVFADAHDERDFVFAKKYNIPLKPTLKPVDGKDEDKIKNLEICFSGEGILFDSGKFSGMTTREAKTAITNWLAGQGLASKKVQYKLRDWVFSRQRYWGEPIPLVHCPTCGIVAVAEKDLPVKLPNVKKYEPTGTGESPLAVIDKWVNVKCPNCGGKAKRETNTMPQWAGSSWYYIRYTDPKNKKEIAKKELMQQWLPVDVYFGGMEHTTLHLLYSRFWNLFLHDQGIVPVSEPYTKRVPHGIILAEDGEKMSKSKGNVVNPDEIVKLYGADTTRMYELFLGPHEQAVTWNSRGIIGVRRFLDRIYLVYKKLSSLDKKKIKPTQSKTIHRAIKKITQDIENYRFNTAISELMITFNDRDWISKLQKDDQFESNEIDLVAAGNFLKLLSPFAPHLAEELWHELGNKDSIVLAAWPEYDPELIKEDKVKIAVQVNGRLRATIEMAVGASQEEAEKLAKTEPNLKKYLEGNIRKVIYVPGKILNFVIQ